MAWTRKTDFTSLAKGIFEVLLPASALAYVWRKGNTNAAVKFLKFVYIFEVGEQLRTSYLLLHWLLLTVRYMQVGK
jgi:triphosphoribosyl-dephospho-CoA synthetase